METQYSANVLIFVSMLASLMRHQVKNYHHHLVYVSIQLYPDFLYGLATQKMFSLLSSTLANFSFAAVFLAVQTACHTFHFASKNFSFLPPAFHNFHNLLFSDISLLTFSFHHHVCFLHMPLFVHHKSSIQQRVNLVSTSTKNRLLAHLPCHSFHQ